MKPLLTRFAALSTVSAVVVCLVSAIALGNNKPNTNRVHRTNFSSAMSVVFNTPSPSIYDFTLKNIDGKDVKLADYKGSVLLVVNVASKCGYTPQYEALQKIYTQYKDKGFVVLGFPANNFGGQEPGTEAEIKTFCSTKYSVNFPIFSKISVKGSDMHPLYKYLTTAEGFSGDIKWNFGKFLIGKDGKILARFEPRDTPDGETVTKALEAALK